MNDPHEITIRVQALGGQWEALGADRYRDVVPEGITFSSNEWGPDTCSFTLSRDAGAIHPDLTTWTPVEVEVAGVVTWDGRIKETPITEGDNPTISVQCEGWQYHLDDDVYEYKYVHTRLSDYIDARSIPVADLVRHRAWGQVNSDGVITLMCPKDTIFLNNDEVAVVLDLGTTCVSRRVVATIESSNNSAVVNFYIWGSDTPSWVVTNNASIAGPFVNNSGATGTVSGTSGTYRYVTLVMHMNSNATAGSDIWFKVRTCQVFANTTYESGNASILKADTIVKDVLGRTVFLTDTSGVQAGTFNIPEFALEGSHSFREVINAANAYENYEVKVLVGRRLHFKPRASTPAYEIGEWSGADFQDASANSGDEIFNRVIVQGTGPDGAQMTIERGNPGPPWKQAPEVVVPNTGLEVDTTGWVAGLGTLARDTVVFQSGVASGRSTTNVNGRSSVVSTITGLVPGRSYLVSIGLRRAVSVTAINITMVNTAFLPGGTWDFIVTHTNATLALNTWVTLEYTFTAVSTSVYFAVDSDCTSASVQDAFYFDNLRYLRSAATLADRRDFTRTKILPVSSSITLTSGNRIADLYLVAHRTTPFKGGFQAVGEGGVRRVLGGHAVHPSHIQTGQMVRCSHRIDPDTGGWGRDGRIATVQYNHDTLTSGVSLDENRAGLETLLGRLAVVQGQRRT